MNEHADPALVNESMVRATVAVAALFGAVIMAAPAQAGWCASDDLECQLEDLEQRVGDLETPGSDSNLPPDPCPFGISGRYPVSAECKKAVRERRQARQRLRYLGEHPEEFQINAEFAERHALDPDDPRYVATIDQVRREWAARSASPTPTPSPSASSPARTRAVSPAETSGVGVPTPLVVVGMAVVAVGAVGVSEVYRHRRRDQ